ncbi:related to S. pombe trp-asp repeat containing protein [Serendipita indica DSM 11827]|uniref:Related to S. pombe trp-asp repeat containing protein n=1 Tax=Serendipita indica (strain DSM 11827) TaxID=1109443 RepID=G4TZR9_SERID|nr:related to S. pombe trp-asp repeat containing protein [Serendipita indica DSM 11827]
MEEQSKANADSTAILQLPTVDFAASTVHRTCLEGTRKAVLQMIWDWANDDASDKPIFWLCDIAGSGKSTVATSALETWQREGALGGRFFFSIASNEASTTGKFCSTIARDLAHYIPQLMPGIADAIKRNPSFLRSSLEEQLRVLVTGPVLRRQQRVILVIDAVDECKSGTQRKQLLDALCVAVQECKKLKIFMTSRPDPVIQSTLGAISIKAKVENRLHDVNHIDNVDDIAAYIHRSLDEILSPDKRQRLVEKAQGLFIWASTACRMLNSEATWDTPENIYDRLISVDKAGDIDDVYGLIFERIDPKAQESMCKMLALLLAAFEPLTVDEVQDILTHVKVRGSVKVLVQNLGSVLSVDERTQLIQFRHPTLVEYLRRCSMTPATSKFSIKLAEAHGQAASWCLNRLTSRTDGLKFNICQIESSFFLNKQIPNLADRISKFIPRQLQKNSNK